MKTAEIAVIGLLLLAGFVVAAPTVASDDSPGHVEDCINVSVTSPGAAVDVWCLLPSEHDPRP